MEPLTFSALSAHKLGIFMPPSRHPMKKHICSCCTIELVNTGTWNIRNPRKSSFAKMFRNLLGAKQVENGFSSPLAALTFLLLPRVSADTRVRQIETTIFETGPTILATRATLKKKDKNNALDRFEKRRERLHCLL